MSGKRMKQLRRAVKAVWANRPDIQKEVYKEAKRVQRDKRISN